MGSGYFGIPKMGNSNDKSSSSSRKSKKSGSEKPKQPQRGLGVAQLEQIRLRSQMGCSGFNSSPAPATFHQEDVRLQGLQSYGVQQSSTSYNNPYYSQSTSPSTSSTSYAHHPNFMMVFGDHERSNLRYQDSQPSSAQRWNPNGILESSTYTQAGAIPRHRISYYEDSRHQRIDFLRNSQNSESSDQEEVDLELRLSL
ncbi:protein SPEAR3-like [Chenopodium quinoa]|uniref:protein SPEAR3-like n=1 Tax=Chenopodium quinoa TaxID=63459 RepID=UPI000B783411|nr:protein SPEAR3-like [Chenopodium quinoa]